MSISNSQPNVSNLRPYLSNPPVVTDGIFCFAFEDNNGVSGGIHDALKEEKVYNRLQQAANNLQPRDLATVFKNNVTFLALLSLKKPSSYPNYLKVLKVFQRALTPYFELVESNDSQRDDLLKQDTYKKLHNHLAAKCEILNDKDLAEIFSSHGEEKKSSSSSTEKKV